MAVGVVSFFLSVTPVMYDCWNLESDERADQQFHVLKNSTLRATALAFLGVASGEKSADGTKVQRWFDCPDCGFEAPSKIVYGAER